MALQRGYGQTIAMRPAADYINIPELKRSKHNSRMYICATEQFAPEEAACICATDQFAPEFTNAQPSRSRGQARTIKSWTAASPAPKNRRAPMRANLLDLSEP